MSNRVGYAATRRNYQGRTNANEADTRQMEGLGTPMKMGQTRGLECQ